MVVGGGGGFKNNVIVYVNSLGSILINMKQQR